MDDLIRPIEYIGANACPKCRHRITVSTVESMTHEINKEGVCVSSKNNDLLTFAVGICTNCRTKYPMLETNFGFIHDCEFNRRKLFLKAVDLLDAKSRDTQSNPMLKK